MDPRDFQKLGAKLAAGTESSEVRTAISRSYYSVFNVGVELLRGMGFHISKGSSVHGDVEHKLSNSGNREVNIVASQLASLRSKRIQADYRLENKKIENQKTAQALVQQAYKMIQVLDRCRSDPEKGQIIKAIQEYSKKISPSQ